MIQKITRRMKCSAQGCRERAAYAFGKRTLDYGLCEKHFKEAILEGMEILNGAEHPEVAKNAHSTSENAQDAIAAAVEPGADVDTTDKAPAEKPKTKKNYNTCKYCGEKFPKDGNLVDYMNHVKACKKEHDAKEREKQRAAEKAAKAVEAAEVAPDVVELMEDLQSEAEK